MCKFSKFKSIVSIGLLLLVSSLSFSQSNDPVSIMIKEGQVNNQTMEHLNTFSNTFGGRVIGSDAYDNAIEWAAFKLREWGYEVELQEAGTLPVGFNRGPWFGRMLDDEGMNLHFVTPSYTRGTKGVQRGRVLNEPKTQAEFDRMKGALKGAWVLISGKSGGWAIDYSANGDKKRAEIIADNLEISKRNSDIQQFNRENPNNKKELEKYNEEPALFYKEMVEAGILGIIQSARVPLQAMYDRNNINTMDFNNLPPVPDIKLDEKQYDIIAEKVRLREYFLLEFDIRNHFKMGPVKYHNLLAKYKGTKKPNELIICGGHLDAYDVATGGVDCGTGIAPTMEAARLIAKAIKETGKRPERTLVFAMWAGEEFGLLGSQYFVEQMKKESNVKIINYFNRDGGPTVANSITVPDSWFENMDKVCKPLYKASEQFPFTLKKREGEARAKPKKAGGTDASSFAVAGFPTISFSTGDPLGYNFSYGEIWHTERDTYDKSFPDYMEHTSVVNAVVMWGMSNSKLVFNLEDVYKKE
jgi:hypothetical protein